MVSDDLKLWINKQRTEGFSTDQIREALINNGYTPEDANRALSQTISFSISKPMPPQREESSPTSNKSKMWLWIIIATIVVAGIIVALFLMTGEKGSNAIVVIGLNTSELTPELQRTGGVVDCGIVTDELINDCYAFASKECKKARIFRAVPLDMFGTGMFVTQETNEEIKGMDGDRCVVYKTIINVTVSFSDELIQQLKDSGETDIDIEQAKKDFAEKNSYLGGKEGACKYNLDYWVVQTEYLENKTAHSSTEDETNYECTGTLYDLDSEGL
ncbi:MAG: hypothetical protein NUV97_00115 [archaeon]|nr:hypothetical protein [archaeon]MCR4323583.1 hypothetical protein [Nanoarchaeota archaeon]